MVFWEGPGEPIVLTLYAADGEVVMVVMVPLVPKRAFLAQPPPVVQPRLL